MISIAQTRGVGGRRYWDSGCSPGPEWEALICPSLRAPPFTRYSTCSGVEGGGTEQASAVCKVLTAGGRELGCQRTY